MTTPQDEPAGDQIAEPTVSTAPTSSTAAAPPTSRWWHWGALPDHLGRARTSTVIFSVLFLAIFTLYLNVRPDVQPTGTTPAGGGSDVEAPVNPLVPSEPTTPEPSEEPAPITDPDEPTEAPTTSRTPSSSSPRPTDPTTGSTEPTEPTGTSEPTSGTTEQDTPAPSSPPTP